MIKGRYSSIIIFPLLVLGICSCGDAWKDWKVVRNETDIQIRQSPDASQWMYLRKKRNPVKTDDFQQVTGPFNGNAPAYISTFNWTGPYLDSVFGSKDSLHYMKTIVVSSQRNEAGKDSCDLRVFNDRGDLINTYSLGGICGEPRINSRDRHYLVFADQGSGQTWLILDYLTGKIAGPVGLKLPAPISVSAIREFEILNNEMVIIQQLNHQTGIYMYSFEGTPLLQITLPMEFKASVHNKTDKELIITGSEIETFADIIQLSGAPSIHPVGSQGRRQGIPGMSTDVQYQRIGGKDRWFYSAYEQVKDQQTIQIMDENEKILNTHVFNGQIKMSRIMGKQMDRMVWALDRIDNTDMVVIDLETGQLVNVMSMPGKFKNSIEHQDHLSAQVSTDQIGVVLNHELLLY